MVLSEVEICLFPTFQETVGSHHKVFKIVENDVTAFFSLMHSFLSFMLIGVYNYLLFNFCDGMCFNRSWLFITEIINIKIARQSHETLGLRPLR